MTGPNLHDDLLEQYPDEDPQEIREDTLNGVDWSTFQSAAREIGVYEHGDDKLTIRTKLAEAGVFRGGVGDDAIYRYNEETDEVETLLVEE